MGKQEITASVLNPTNKDSEILSLKEMVEHQKDEICNLRAELFIHKNFVTESENELLDARARILVLESEINRLSRHWWERIFR